MGLFRDEIISSQELADLEWQASELNKVTAYLADVEAEKKETEKELDRANEFIEWVQEAYPEAVEEFNALKKVKGK